MLSKKDKLAIIRQLTYNETYVLNFRNTTKSKKGCAT